MPQARRAGTDLVRVVLADDTPEIRQALRLSLEADGRFHVVGEAEDGREAVRVTSTQRPHVILLDLAMPVMDGLQAIPHIRRESPETRIVVLSGFSASRMSDEAIARGADRYVTKGVGFRELADELVDLSGRPRGGDASPAEVRELTEDEQRAALIHELRRPLGAIRALAGALRAAVNDLDPGLLVTIADALARNADSIERVSDQLTDPSSHLRLEPERVDLTALLRQELQTFAHATAGRLVGLVAPPAVMARCDPARMRQIVATLVGNVVEHTPPDTPLEIELQAQDGMAELVVRDYGPGMSPAEVEEIFSAAAGRRALGLFVAHAIANAHGGDLRLSRPEGGGCRFVLTVPLDD